jgi:hypothetical protein
MLRGARRVSLGLMMVAVVGLLPAAATPKAEGCAAVHLSAILPMPPAGYEFTQATSFGEDCTVVRGPLVLQAASSPMPSLVAVQGPLVVRNLPLRTGIGNLATGQGSIEMSASGSRHFYTHSEIQGRYDWGLVLNLVRTETDWTWKNSQVYSYASGGTYAWHEEAGGGGWTPHGAYNVRESGGAGQSSATIHAHVAFSYCGVFDCSGYYYNVLDNRPTIYNNGGYSCRLDMYAAHYPYAWKTWIAKCGVPSGGAS